MTRLRWDFEETCDVISYLVSENRELVRLRIEKLL